MTLRWLRNIALAPMAGLLMALPLATSPPANHPTANPDMEESWDFTSEASDLLQEVKDLSGRLQLETEWMEVLPNSSASWEGHANRLVTVRDHVNEIGKRLSRLQEIRHVTAPWQQQAIDRIMPVAVELAQNTQAAIEHLNENRGRILRAPAYTEHLTAIAERTDEMRDSVSTFLEYADTEQKLERLERKLELSES